jgi:glycosyltransferase involved in cell wall biosynthesis
MFVLGERIMMRVAMANNYYYLKGGAERVLFEEKRMLEARSHQVAVFSQMHPSNESSPYDQYFPPFKDWQNASWLGRVPTALKIIYDRRTGRSFERFLGAAQPDLVHAHNIYGGLTTSILDATQQKGIPVVMTLHDYKLICPSYLMLNHGRICEDCHGGKFIYCLLNRCHKDSLVASGVYCIESYFNRWLGKYDTVRHFICPSRFSLSKHAENGIPEDRLVYIPNFINAREHEAACEKGGYALFVGRLSKEKGIGTLLHAARNLDVPVRIVGDGPLRADYERFVSEHQMTHVAFEGYKSGGDLKSLYTNAAFVVVPSEWYENAPMTILEACAYGKPVIGSHIGGISEMVEPGRTGLLFRPGDADELAGCIRTLWADESLRVHMGRAARDKVEKEFSAQVHYERLMEIYEKALGHESQRFHKTKLVRFAG